MCVNCGINRRDFLKLTSTLSAGALLGLSACHKAVAQQPVRVGYLAITDAAPLLVAHSRGRNGVVNRTLRSAGAKRS